MDNNKDAEGNPSPIDHVIVTDGKKAGAVGVTTIHDGTGAILEDVQLNSTELDMRNLRLQQDLKSKGTKPSKVGTQVTKNLMAVVKPERIYTDDKTGVEMLEDYNNTISKLSDIELQSWLNEIGYSEETGEVDDVKFRESLAREFKDELAPNVIDQILGNIPMDGITINERIQYKVNATIKKKAVELKQLGGAMVQMANFGIMGAEVEMNDQIKNGIRWLSSDTNLQPMRLEEKIGRASCRERV